MSTAHVPFDTSTELDSGNIVHLEHINLYVPDAHLAAVFYQQGLGLTRDPFAPTRFVSSKLSWYNVGRQQIHIVVHKIPQIVNGTIGLTMPDLRSLEDRLNEVEPELRGSRFAFERSLDGDSVDITCPWGNRFRIHDGSTDLPAVATIGGPTPPKKLKDLEIPPWQLGMAYLDLNVLPNTAKSIGTFFRDCFGARVENTDYGVRVSMGPRQWIRFREDSKLPAPDLSLGAPAPDLAPLTFDGWHACIYITDFARAFRYAQERRVLFTKHSFADKVDRWDEAARWRQLRTNDIPASSKVIERDDTAENNADHIVYQLQLEVRSLMHANFLRPLVNVRGQAGIYAAQ